MKRFKDFAKEEGSLDGEKVRIGELFNKEICLIAFRLMQSKCPGITDKQCLQIQFKFTEDGENNIVFTNSEVLIKQLKEYESELPFWTIIQKKGSYYTLT